MSLEVAHVKDKHDHVYLRVHLNDLERAIKGEAEDHLVMAIPPDRGKLLQQENSDFWNGLIDKFPSAFDDLESALFCYACDEGTARVFIA